MSVVHIYTGIPDPEPRSGLGCLLVILGSVTFWCVVAYLVFR